MSNLFFPLSHCGHATSRHVSDRWSTSGFVFSLGHEAISWSSKKQPIIALSSTEPKYRGIAIATCEEIWLKLLRKDSIYLSMNRYIPTATMKVVYNSHRIWTKMFPHLVALSRCLGTHNRGRCWSPTHRQQPPICWYLHQSARSGKASTDFDGAWPSATRHLKLEGEGRSQNP